MIFGSFNKCERYIIGNNSKKPLFLYIFNLLICFQIYFLAAFVGLVNWSSSGNKSWPIARKIKKMVTNRTKKILTSINIDPKILTIGPIFLFTCNENKSLANWIEIKIARMTRISKEGSSIILFLIVDPLNSTLTSSRFLENEYTCLISQYVTTQEFQKFINSW